MQKVVYSCDQCKKEFGQKKHISLSFGRYSGIAMPPDPRDVVGRWIVRCNLEQTFKHFCGAQCVSRFFSKLMTAAENGQE